MPRGGAIMGTVLDEHAEATPGIQVRALRVAVQAGQRSLQSTRSGTTDDRGIYRIYGLQPGDYVVCATPRGAVGMDTESLRTGLEVIRRSVETAVERGTLEGPLMQQRAALLQSQLGEETQAGFAPVCFPGSGSPPGASTITLAAGEERAAVDFQLQLVPLARIEGSVVNPSGALLQNVQVTLAGAGDLAQIENRTARADRDGRFRLTSVPPGQYTLIARAAVRPSPDAQSTPQTAAEKVAATIQERSGTDRIVLWSTMDVSIDGRSLTNVVVTLQPGVTLSGQVSFDGASQPPADPTRVRITLSPVNPDGAVRGLASSATGRPDAVGRFTIRNVVPGRYRVTAGGAGGWSIESAVVGGQDAADFPVEIRANQNVTAASITFTDRPTEFAGAVLDERNQPVSAYTVVVYPADPRYWTGLSRRIQAHRPATDGRFAFRSLPPGEYRLATLFDPEPGSWYDPAFLQQLEASSTSFSIAAGETKVQNVRVSSAR
jgi:protocatechuate 3,4-dioxygenase beta subunit